MRAVESFTNETTDDVNVRNTWTEVAKDIVKLVNSSNKIPFVGVAGAGASGKSYFCKEIKKLLSDQFSINALVIGMDGYHYYRSQLDQMDDPKYAHERRGAEFTFDADRFVKDISKA